jgi:hypothetical protein
MNITEARQFLERLEILGLSPHAVPSATRPSLASILSQKSKALDNNVHALFRFSAWENITYPDYMLLLPALRLASSLLEQDSVINWFCRTLHGTLNANDDGTSYFLDANIHMSIVSTPASVYMAHKLTIVIPPASSS